MITKWISAYLPVRRLLAIIAAARGSDRSFVKQICNPFIMLNERREVVGRRLTKSTAFYEIQDLLDKFKCKLHKGLERIVVGDCCKGHASYQSIFPGVEVKLDLFHAVQRVTKTLQKGYGGGRWRGIGIHASGQAQEIPGLQYRRMVSLIILYIFRTL